MIYHQWIEDNAERLVDEVVKEILTSKDLIQYRRLLTEEAIRERIHEIIFTGFKHLESWLSKHQDEAGILAIYEAIGRERCLKGIPMEEVIQVFLLLSRKVNQIITENKLFDPKYRIDELSNLNRETTNLFSKIVQALILGYDTEQQRKLDARKGEDIR